MKRNPETPNPNVLEEIHIAIKNANPNLGDIQQDGLIGSLLRKRRYAKNQPPKWQTKLEKATNNLAEIMGLSDVEASVIEFYIGLNKWTKLYSEKFTDTALVTNLVERRFKFLFEMTTYLEDEHTINLKNISDYPKYAQWFSSLKTTAG